MICRCLPSSHGTLTPYHHCCPALKWDSRRGAWCPRLQIRHGRSRCQWSFRPSASSSQPHLIQYRPLPARHARLLVSSAPRSCRCSVCPWATRGCSHQTRVCPPQAVRRLFHPEADALFVAASPLQHWLDWLCRLGCCPWRCCCQPVQERSRLYVKSRYLCLLWTTILIKCRLVHMDA